MKKILHVAAEAVPFVKTGGLADVIGSLPKELKKQGLDVRVVLPKYGDIPQKYKDEMQFVTHFEVAVGWRQKYCGIATLEYEGVTFYFIDNEEYFGRSGLYGHFDDAERFAFFCRAVLEMLPQLEYQPDVIHSHDWHAALVSIFLRTQYDSSFYQGIRTLFTIHNLRYQGVFTKEIMGDILGLDWEYFRPDALEFYGSINFMKGGIVASDLISTVSDTYAQEIQYPFFGEQLDGLLRARKMDLVGIVNGIDYDIYNPASDPHIASSYDVNSIDQKMVNKLKLQEQLGLPLKREVPVIAIISRLVSAKGLDLVAHIFDELIAYEDVQLVVLGTGEEQYQNLFQHAAWTYPSKVSVHINFDEALAHQIYAGADMFLMPSLYEPCGIGQLIALRYGTLPIVRETGGLKDTVHAFSKYTCEGNGFTFAPYNAHDMFYTIKRALGMYYDKPTWRRIVENAMNSDFSWRYSAQKYISLYRQLSD